MEKIITSVYWLNDHKWLERYGEECWEVMCDAAPINRWFRLQLLADAWQAAHPGSSRQRLREIRLVWANVMAQEPGRKDMERDGHFLRFNSVGVVE